MYTYIHHHIEYIVTHNIYCIYIHIYIHIEHMLLSTYQYLQHISSTGHANDTLWRWQHTHKHIGTCMQTCI